MSGRVSWLNLHLWIPQKDVRKLIYAKLNRIDRFFVKVAHGIQFQVPYGYLLTACTAREATCTMIEWCLTHCKERYYEGLAKTLFRQSVASTQSEDVLRYLYATDPKGFVNVGMYDDEFIDSFKTHVQNRKNLL